MIEESDKPVKKRSFLLITSLGAFVLLAGIFGVSSLTAEGPIDLGDGRLKVPVVFEGGHETKPEDHGRPVILIASALGVEEQVFRDAFSNVNPAPGGTIPGHHRVQENKKVLMDALSPHGITNDRLDEVSNYYRYSKSWGQLWRHRPAKAYAIVESGRVTEFEIVDGGAGYSSKPKVRVEGADSVYAEIDLLYGTEFKTNGSISRLMIQK